MTIIGFPVILGMIVPVLTSLLIIIALALRTFKQSLKNPRVARIASYIESGASTFLRTEYSVIMAFDAVTILLLFLTLGPKTAFAFTLGAALSLTSGFAGMKVATKASARTTESVNENVSKGLKMALSGGSVMGISVASLSLLGILILVFLPGQNPSRMNMESLTGYAMGASLTAIFIQMGGGIFTKSADIGADLVGKLERGLAEDDPRNPAVVADLVGDNVGDCAGRGADLFQTIGGDLVTSMIIGLGFLDRYGNMILLFPPLFFSIGLISTILSIFVAFKINDPIKSFLISISVATVLSTVGLYSISTLFVRDISLFYAGLSGILVTLLMAIVSDYYTGLNSSTIRGMYESAKRGAAINMISGFAHGLRGAVIPVFLVSIATVFSYFVTGSIYGLVVANLGSDILIGTVMTWDTFGPIVDNAGGINEISSTRGNDEAFDVLDALGNTTKAYTKAFSLTSGIFTTFIAIMAYYYVLGKRSIDLMNPFYIAALLIGVAIPFLFSSYIMSAVNSTTIAMVDEARRQFKEKPEILLGLDMPAYNKCIKIATLEALKQMIPPVLIAEAMLLGFGWLFGANALAGMLIGLLGSSAILGIKYILIGGAFDNTKKLFELSGVNDESLRSAVVIADTFGDPLKDVLGPSLTILMKSAVMTALTFEVALLKYALFPV